jgi:hypothetical protein
MSQETIECFRLELARPGPLYGQLLSRLTNYLALCDGVEADTFQLPFAHYEIEEDLQGLRYHLEAPQGGEPIPNTFRATCLERLGNRVGGTISQMHGFQTRYAEGAKADLTHLRLLLNGGELSLIPFELALVPPGWRGSGARLTLQVRERTVVTRELRDSSRYPVEWKRSPRVLFCTASPEGFEPPPAQAHLNALSQALRPWTKSDEAPPITVLDDASLESITLATRKAEYTHVHLLAHGAPIPKRRERYGVVLSHRRNRQTGDIVDARALAGALWGDHQGRKPPTMVTLASCDSANQANVVWPGSSFAHDLHREGVPWVIGSQMPLTFAGSVVLARVLYGGLFAGEEPRWVLYRLRNELSKLPDTHDWASIVIYAAIPDDFSTQSRAFSILQIRRLIDAGFDRVAVSMGESHSSEEKQATCNAEFAEIDRQLARWESLLHAAPKGRNDADRCEFFGMRGSIAKQQAEFSVESKVRQLLVKSAQCYRHAATLQLGNHWVIVQYLSLRTLLSQSTPDNAEVGSNATEPGFREMAEFAAMLDLGKEGQDRRWALGSLLELAVLTNDGLALGRTFDSWAEEFASGLDPKSFEYRSTLRQLRRYFDKGQFVAFASRALQERARSAVTTIARIVASPA